MYSIFMKKFFLTLFAFVPCLLAAAPEEGFVSLTNGKDLTGWKTVGGNGQFKFEWTAGLYDEARRGWLFPNKANKEQCAAFSEQGAKVFKWEDWNEIRILCEGNHIQIFLNGEKRVDFVDDGKEFTPEGFLGMQVHSGAATNVRWRNLRIKELAAK